MNQTLKTNRAESIPLAVAIIVLLIAPLWGPVAMFVSSTTGLAVCIFLYRKRLHKSGWVVVAGVVSVAAVMASAVAFAMALV